MMIMFVLCLDYQYYGGRTSEFWEAVCQIFPLRCCDVVIDTAI
jgi:hypothetical protein